MKKIKKMTKKKKAKMGDFKVCSFAIRKRSFSFNSHIYSIAVLYLTLHSLVSAVFSLFQNFAPVQMYRENETTSTIPT